MHLGRFYHKKVPKRSEPQEPRLPDPDPGERLDFVNGDVLGGVQLDHPVEAVHADELGSAPEGVGVGDLGAVVGGSVFVDLELDVTEVQQSCNDLPDAQLIFL